MGKTAKVVAALALSAVAYEMDAFSKVRDIVLGSECQSPLERPSACNKFDNAGVPQNLTKYVIKTADKNLYKRGYDQKCGLTPCVFAGKWGYIIHRQGWPMFYEIPTANKYVIWQGVRGQDELRSRAGNIASSLLISLGFKEFDANENIRGYEFGQLNKSGQSHRRDFVRLELPSFE